MDDLDPQPGTSDLRRTPPGALHRRRLGRTLIALLAGATAVVGPAGASPALGSSGRMVGLSTGGMIVSGHGFGHGVGMSQYGALGMARAGNAVGAILEHYYSGTTVTPVPDTLDLRVNVVDRGARVTLRSTALDAGGGTFRLVTAAASAPVVLGAGDVAVVTPITGGQSVAVTRASGAASIVSATRLLVQWSGTRALAGPATTLDLASTSRNGLSTSGKSRRYRWGALEFVSVPRVDSDGVARTRLEAVERLDLHSEYLRGVAEMPSSWPPAALQAQVVAARSYAMTAYLRGTSRTCGSCNLWDDTRSQVYSGWAKESETVGRTRYGARWVAAVQATERPGGTGLTVLYQGKPITAYFSSSSGGRTRDAQTVWGTPAPYLRSVADPWSVDPTVNPTFAHWDRTVPVTRLLGLFGLPDIATITVTRRDEGGAALALTATSAAGVSSTVTGTRFSSRLGLPAAWVTGVAAPPARPPVSITRH